MAGNNFSPNIINDLSHNVNATDPSISATSNFLQKQIKHDFEELKQEVKKELIGNVVGGGSARRQDATMSLIEGKSHDH